MSLYNMTAEMVLDAKIIRRNGIERKYSKEKYILRDDIECKDSTYSTLFGGQPVLVVLLGRPIFILNK